MVTRLVDEVVPSEMTDESEPYMPMPTNISSAVKEVGTIPNDHIHNDVAGAVQLSSEIGSVVSALCNLQ